MPNTVTLEAPAGLRSNGMPLQGVTILAVEDSRFASEALRLMCRRLGARLRRAESLRAAASHLKLYRPDIVIVDLGLPDGRGEGLIGEISRGAPRQVVLGMSGDAGGRMRAMAAGAHGYIEKPVENLAAFRAVLMRYLPDRAGEIVQTSEAVMVPDVLALRDDLVRAAALLEDCPGQETYVAGFVGGVARHARDAALADAAESAQMENMLALLKARLSGADHAFDG